MIVPEISGPAKKRPTVLVIDDEAGPRDALKVILRPFFNIQAAASARVAVDVLNSQPIDLITLISGCRIAGAWISSKRSSTTMPTLKSSSSPGTGA